MEIDPVLEAIAKKDGEWGEKWRSRIADGYERVCMRVL